MIYNQSQPHRCSRNNIRWTVESLKTRIEFTGLFRVWRSHRRRKNSGKGRFTKKAHVKGKSTQKEGAILHLIPARSLLINSTSTSDWQSRHLTMKPWHRMHLINYIKKVFNYGNDVVALFELLDQRSHWHGNQECRWALQLQVNIMMQRIANMKSNLRLVMMPTARGVVVQTYKNNKTKAYVLLALGEIQQGNEK